jgi:hypothetical protein
VVVALIVLILLLLLFGGGPLLAPALNILWLVLVIGLILWLLGFFVRAAEGSRWYYW